MSTTRVVLRRALVLARRSIVVSLAILASVHVSHALVPSPTVEGPITGGKGTPSIASTTFDLEQVGYRQEEYFISGEARAYTSSNTFSPDGRWMAIPATLAAYKTRILVYKPKSPKRFNGTVVVEWLNVTSGVDFAPDWVLTHTELIREGFAWVGVSAQAVGVEGGTTIMGAISTGFLKAVDPPRYGSLHHPGDTFSYDIFSQAGEILRHSKGIRPLGALRAKRMLAAGNSQSAFRLVTYINAIHASAGVYDGYFVHSRGSIGAALSQGPQPGIPVLGSAPIRDDLEVPVLIFATETDFGNLGALNYFLARQPDSKSVRVWEVAGTSHTDAYIAVFGRTDAGRAAMDITYSPLVQSIGSFVTCLLPINAGPQHYVASAAIRRLDRWVRRGIPPSPAPRLETVGGTATLQRDEHGIAVGGIRTPQVDVPIATFSGEGQFGRACALLGTTTPLDAATLDSLYPDHRTYVSAVRKATKAAVRAGFIRRIDGRAIKAAAAASGIGCPSTSSHRHCGP